MEPDRAVAVERLTALLEEDVLTVDEYNDLVDRILATTSSGELDLVLAAVPTTMARALVLVCGSGVVKEVPATLPESIEIRIDTGVMKIDLSKGEIESSVTDIDIDAATGVLKVILPHDAVVEVVEHISEGGVFANKVKAVKDEAWRPRLLVHVRNQGAVVKLTRARR